MTHASKADTREHIHTHTHIRTHAHTDLIRDNLQGQIKGEHISLDALETIVTVARDALIDGEQHEIDTVLVALVQRLENVREDRRVCSLTSAIRPE